MLIKEDISKKVLTFGPAYKNHRGGIGAVIDVYSTFFEKFNFVPSYHSYDSNIAKILYFFGQFFVLTKTLIVNRDIRIVHIHGSHGGSFYRKFVAFLIAKKLFRKKIVYHIHSGTFNSFYLSSKGLQKKWIRKLVNGADAVICLAPVWADFLRENFQPKKIYIVNNVVTEPAVKALQGASLSSPVMNLLFLGKVGDNKGIFDLLEVIKQQKEFLNGKIRLFIGGDGEIDKLKAFITGNELSGMVEYAGWVDKEKKNLLFLDTHLYILPSYNEGLPGSILEAMSYGLPVIATPVGGIPEVVKDRVNGRLIQPGSLAGIEESLRFFLADKQLIPQYGQASLQMIGPFFPEYVARQLVEVYTAM